MTTHKCIVISEDILITFNELYHNLFIYADLKNKNIKISSHFSNYLSEFIMYIMGIQVWLLRTSVRLREELLIRVICVQMAKGCIGN